VNNLDLSILNFKDWCNCC